MTVQDKILVWLDCDPGQDDTVAIIIGCYGKHFNLIGVSTVHGNVSLNNTTCNALRVLTAIGKTEIPVYPGEAKALDNYAEIFAADVHGTTGLNGSNLLPLPKMKPQNKSDFFPHLAKAIEENEHRLNIVATGPLTNIALFFRKYPHLKEKICWLSIMGGGFNVYNINDSSEFNYFCDPYAAKEIIEDPVLCSKIIQAPLDITTKVFVSEEIQTKILDGKTFETASNFRSMMFELIDSFNKRMLAQHLPKYEGPVIHDPVALVALLQFENITDKLGFKYDRRSYKISIDPATYGKIISVVEDNNNGAYVLTDLDVDEFWNLVLGVYRTTDQHAYMNLISREQLINDFMNSN
jgi:uridine nucleosidase